VYPTDTSLVYREGFYGVTPDPSSAREIQSRFCQIQIPRKIVWQNRVRIEAPPPARFIEGRVPQKNVLILLEEKIRPSPNQKSGEHFFAGHASGASGGGADSFVQRFWK